MPEAKNLLAFLVTVRQKFNDAKVNEHKFKPDLVTITDALLAGRPMKDIEQILHEFDCMTVNYDVFNCDRAVLGGLLHDGEIYHRKRLSFVAKAIIYGQYETVQAEDQNRLQAARQHADQEELAS